MEVFARSSPEAAGQFGVDGLDEEIFQLPLDLSEQTIAATEEALSDLRARLELEQHAAVRQDLEILVEAAEQGIEGTRISDKYDLPYFNLRRPFSRESARCSTIRSQPSAVVRRW